MPARPQDGVPVEVLDTTSTVCGQLKQHRPVGLLDLTPAPEQLVIEQALNGFIALFLTDRFAIERRNFLKEGFPPWVWALMPGEPDEECLAHACTPGKPVSPAWL